MRQMVVIVELPEWFHPRGAVTKPQHNFVKCTQRATGRERTTSLWFRKPSHFTRCAVEVLKHVPL